MPTLASANDSYAHSAKKFVGVNNAIREKVVNGVLPEWNLPSFLSLPENMGLGK